MPAKFDKCLIKVRRSLKKYKRKGNPYAICMANFGRKGRVKALNRGRKWHKNM